MEGRFGGLILPLLAFKETKTDSFDLMAFIEIKTDAGNFLKKRIQIGCGAN